jgi:CelD/BcsL family acetyltransferase involved in cellulose biosynthesis
LHDILSIRRLTVERLRAPEAMADIAAEWDMLDRQIAPRTPFTSSSWMIAWWKHFSRHRQTLFHDEFFCHVVRDAAGRLVAVAPLMRTSVPGIGPPVMRMLQFFGVDPALTEIRGVICRPEDHAPVVEALVEHFLARRNEWDVFRWAGLRQPIDTYGALCKSRAFTAREGLSDFVVELPKSWNDLRLHVSSNMRKNLRKCYESLERDGLAIALRVTERPDSLGAAMARFLALHAARAEAVGMISHPDKFAGTRERAFFEYYLQSAANRGELRIFELEIGGAVVASRVTFLIASDLYLYFAGYDPAWKSYSVMTVLMSEMFKWAFANGVQRVNLSTGRDQSKDRWKPREVLFGNAVQVSPTLRAKAAFGPFRAYETLGQARIKAAQRKRGRHQPVDPPDPSVANPAQRGHFSRVRGACGSSTGANADVSRSLR